MYAFHTVANYLDALEWLLRTLGRYEIYTISILNDSESTKREEEQQQQQQKSVTLNKQ